VIFSRKRGSSGRHGTGSGAGAAGSAGWSGVAEDGKGGRHARRRGGRQGELNEHEPVDLDDGDPADEPPPFGPYDVDQAPDDGQERLDLGALRIPAVAGVKIHLQAGPQGQIQQVQLAHGGSRLQLTAFAAPRTEGIWDEIRATLRSSLTAGGARPQEVDGDYGVELRARVKDQSGAADVRHVGIDGPRWFVHGVYIGAAAVDPDRAGPLRDVLRGLVVDRGTEARPVSEVLPLQLPAEAAAQLAEAAAAGPESQAT
jgi:hypothetical protein